MAFSDAEKADIRRFCGYPLYGGVPSSFQSYRFFQVYGTLEYRMANLSTTEETVVRGNLLLNCYTLEAAIPGVSANLDTDQAAVWTHNKRELADRVSLYNYWRRELCAFFGVPPGPSLGEGGGAQLVV